MAKLPDFTLEMLDHAEALIEQTIRDAKQIQGYALDLHRDMSVDEQVINLIERLKNMSQSIADDIRQIEDLFIRGEY